MGEWKVLRARKNKCASYTIASLSWTAQKVFFFKFDLYVYFIPKDWSHFSYEHHIAWLNSRFVVRPVTKKANNNYILTDMMILFSVFFFLSHNTWQVQNCMSLLLFFITTHFHCSSFFSIRLRSHISLFIKCRKNKYRQIICFFFFWRKHSVFILRALTHHLRTVFIGLFFNSLINFYIS